MELSGHKRKSQRKKVEGGDSLLWRLSSKTVMPPLLPEEGFGKAEGYSCAVERTEERMKANRRLGSR